MDIQEFYAEINADYQSVLARFAGKQDLISRFLKKFIDDDNFKSLEEAVGAGDYGIQERAAHSLKGLCGNLGLTPLYDVSSMIVQAIRQDEKEKVPELFQSLKKEYERELELINRL